MNDRIRQLEEFAARLPTPEDAGPDEELSGYIRGVQDALSILRGEKPYNLGRDDLT